MSGRVRGRCGNKCRSASGERVGVGRASRRTPAGRGARGFMLTVQPRRAAVPGRYSCGTRSFQVQLTSKRPLAIPTRASQTTKF